MMASSIRMRDLGRRLLIAIGIVLAAAVAVGYAWIAGGIAQPLGAALGSVERPSTDGAFPFQLEDGRPAWVVSAGDEAWVLDARAPVSDGRPGRLVGWCGGAEGVFLDVLDGTTYAATGAVIGGPDTGGLLRYPVTPADGGRTLRVGREAAPVPASSGGDEPVALDCPPGTPWTVHRAPSAEVFDPSVAANEEPRGWVWLEGTLVAVGDQALLCDGLDAGCATGAVARGIDPARVPADDRRLAGIFIGRVEDGAIVDLSFVPDRGGSS